MGSPRQLNAQFRQKENKILTRHVRLGLDTHKHRRSLNVLVIGGSGAAKTRGYVKPNILEANSNYVITDPKMEVLTATGGYLKRQGYDIRVLNLVDLSQSDGYNPFRYLRDEKDALKLVNTLIQATTPKGSHESDPFWSKSETALLQAIILMLFQEAPEYEQNFSMVLRVLEYAEVKEDDDEYVSPLDLLFRAMEYENPESVALRQYKVFKQAAGKTANRFWCLPLCGWHPSICRRSKLSPTMMTWISTRWESESVLCTPSSRIMIRPLLFSESSVLPDLPDPLLLRRPDPSRSLALPRAFHLG